MTRILMLLAVVTFFLMMGCGDAKEPVPAVSESAVSAPVAEETAPVVSQEDIDQMKVEAKQAAASEITSDNLAESATALEKEIDGDEE